MSAPTAEMLSHAERLALITAEFERRYGAPATVAARAPGRVDLMGSHTDYNEGWVLTMSIDRDTWVLARRRDDNLLQVASLNVEEEAAVALDDLVPGALSGWTAYPAGVAWVLMDAGHTLQGADLLVHTTVPLGGGLSSSAALETATSVALEALNGVALDEVQRALLSQRAEREFVGVNCGILDQFTSSAGKAQSVLLLDCRTIEGKSVPIDESLRVVICDTRAKRALATSQYGERRAACEEAAHRLSALLPNVRTLRDVSAEAFAPLAATLPAEPAKRARFIIEEDERVLALASALAEGDRSAIATLAAASFAGARDLYEITVPEMERMLEAMLGAPGVVGARQAGAGFGGCMVAFVDAAQVDAFGREVATAYEAATGITPAIYPVEAAAGAGALPGFDPTR
jgi:galactokinase